MTAFTGQLWYASDKAATITARVIRAVEFYHAKHNDYPNVCYAHPDTLGPDAPKAVGGVRLVARRNVIRQHLWLGVEGQ